MNDPRAGRSPALAPALAFAVAAAGIGLFSIMDAFMKSLTLALGVYNAMIWRTGVSSLFGAAAWLRAGAARPTRRALRLHGLRGAITAIMALLFFWGLARVPMAQAVALSFIAPLLALLLGAVVLGERVGARVVLSSLLALGGVAVILVGQSTSAPGPTALAGALAVLASAVLYAANLIVARLQSQAAGPAEIAFFQSVLVTAFLALGAPWLIAVPEAAQWGKIVAGALLATASLFLLGWAYAHGEAGYLATAEYTSFVHAAALGWLVFGERVSVTTLAGAAIIVAACLYGARVSNAGRRDIAQAALGAAG